MNDRAGLQLGNYKLIRLLGQGGFADVYLGEHIYLKTPAAIKILQTRLASDDLDLMVVAILVQFEIGGNLSRILDSIASTIRERVKLNGEIRTMSAQGRMAGYVLSGMPVAIGGVLMLIAPSYMGALFTPGPWLALPVAAFVGIVVGSLTIRKLVAIEV